MTGVCTALSVYSSLSQIRILFHFSDEKTKVKEFSELPCLPQLIRVLNLVLPTAHKIFLLPQTALCSKCMIYSQDFDLAPQVSSVS